MRATITLALIAACAALPAQAGDRVFAKSSASLLTEGYVGQPLWSLLASCAGAQGAAHAFYAANRRAADADQARTAGAQFLQMAVDRLVVDRRVDRKAALDVTLAAVEAGRASGADALDYPGRDDGLKWLGLQTACDEVAGL
jgi:hypothetical protein